MRLALKSIRTIVFNDVLCILRDPVLLVSAFLMPFILWPSIGIFSGITTLTTAAMMSGEAKNPQPVGVFEDSKLSLLPLFDRERKTFKVTKLEGHEEERRIIAEVDEGTDRDRVNKLWNDWMKEKSLDAIVFALPSEKEAGFELYVVHQKKLGILKTRRLKHGIKDIQDHAVKRIADKVGRTVTQLKGFNVHMEFTESLSSSIFGNLSEMIPWILIFMLCATCASFVSLLLLAEKENGTLSLVWSAPVTSHEIIVSKFISVGLISLIPLILNIVVATFVFSSQTLPIGPAQLFFAGFFVFLTSLCVSAICLAVASPLENQAQAGRTVYILLLVGVAAAGVSSQLPKDSLITACIPFVGAMSGVALSLQQLPNVGYVFLAILSSLALCAVLLALAAQLLQGSLAGINPEKEGWNLPKQHGPLVFRKIPSPLFAVCVFAGLLGFHSYINAWGLLAQRIEEAMFYDVIGLAFVPLLCIRWGRLDFRLSLGLNRCKARYLTSSLLMGLAFAGIPFVVRVWTGSNLEQVPSEVSIWYLFLFIAAMPAVFEELLFRGFLFGAFRQKLPASWTILLTAFAFGFFHLNPAQFLVGFVLGTGAGWLVLRSGSIFPAMLLHFIYNGVQIGVSQISNSFLIIQRVDFLGGSLVNGMILLSLIMMGFALHLGRIEKQDGVAAPSEQAEKRAA